MQETYETQVRSLGQEDPRGGHGNPLQYSCLENPMDRGAWWAAVNRGHRVRHKRLSTSWFLCADSQPSVWVYSLVDLKWALGGYSLLGGRIAFSTHAYQGSFEVLSQMLFWSKFLFLWQVIPLEGEGFWSISYTSNLPLLKPSSQICFISMLIQP